MKMIWDLLPNRFARIIELNHIEGSFDWSRFVEIETTHVYVSDTSVSFVNTFNCDDLDDSWR